MANIVEIDEPHLARGGAEVLENGDLLLLATLPFVVAADEADLLDPAIFSGGSKNVSYNPADGSLRGVALEGEALVMCRNMVARYADFAEGLAKRIAPSYARALQRRRTSFRPGEVAQPAPKAVDPRICARSEPEPAVQGGVVQAATDEERAKLDAFLNGEAEARSWGRRGWERADLARRSACS